MKMLQVGQHLKRKTPSPKREAPFVQIHPWLSAAELVLPKLIWIQPKVQISLKIPRIWTWGHTTTFCQCSIQWPNLRINQKSLQGLKFLTGARSLGLDRPQTQCSRCNLKSQIPATLNPKYPLRGCPTGIPQWLGGPWAPQGLSNPSPSGIPWLLCKYHTLAYPQNLCKPHVSPSSKSCILLYQFPRNANYHSELCGVIKP